MENRHVSVYSVVQVYVFIKKIKSMCIDCGGSGICSHKRIKSHCVECKGASICPHSKRRSRCMIAIYEAIGFRKVVFIRFNPDGYREGIQKYKSPFGYTPTGMISINKEEMARRIARLVEQIDAVKEEPQEPLTIYYLFFSQ